MYGVMKTVKKILVIGSLNMDLVAYVPHLPQTGETISSVKFLKIPGGKGANQAVAAAKLGADVRMIGKVGSDNHGRELLESLQNAKVQTDGVKQEDVTGMALISVSDDGENNIVLVPGANEKLNRNDINNMKNFIRESDLIIMQLEIPLDVVDYVLEISRDLNKKVILNPAPATKLSANILGNVDTLIPNEVELEMITGMPISTDEEIIDAAKNLMTFGIRRILVTLGARGSILINEREQVKIPAYKVKAIDTTAAGDSYIAGFAVGIITGMEDQEAAIFASKVAAVVVTREGAQTSIPTLDELAQIQLKYA